MDRLEQYRSLIQEMLLEYAKRKPAYGQGEIEVQVMFDREHDHYQVMHVGWRGDEWVHSCMIHLDIIHLNIIHLDIKDGKIWLQWDTTEKQVAEDLVKLGIPQEDIAIGFHSPFMRQFTEYAVE